MSYVVIRTGGKQYRVAEGERLRIEKIEGEVGQEVVFADVLLSEKDGAVEMDQAVLSQMKVPARIIGQGRGPKIKILKYRRRKGFQRQQGHRQGYTEVKIGSLSPADATASE